MEPMCRSMPQRLSFATGPNSAKQYSFDLDSKSEAGKTFQGASAGAPSSIADERLEEFAPGLDAELLSLIQATAELELPEVNGFYGPTTK